MQRIKFWWAVAVYIFGTCYYSVVVFFGGRGSPLNDTRWMDLYDRSLNDDDLYNF